MKKIIQKYFKFNPKTGEYILKFIAQSTISQKIILDENIDERKTLFLIKEMVKNIRAVIIEKVDELENDLDRELYPPK